MNETYHTVVIGGGCLGVACAVSLDRALKSTDCGDICLVEKAVLGAGLSSRHSAIVRSANASPVAARIAKKSTEYWKELKNIWGVAAPWSQTGAIWIGKNNHEERTPNAWRQLAQKMQENNIEFYPIDIQKTKNLTSGQIRLDEDELYYFEPDVLQLEASGILQAMQQALSTNLIEVKEHTEVTGFETDHSGKITSVITSKGKINCKHVINASGGWSPRLFTQLGLDIPIALEPVYAANWLISAADLPTDLPIIADFINKAYFRRWRGSILHMHQPRKRDRRQITASFSQSLMNPIGSDIIYDASNYAVTNTQLQHYSDKVINRFPTIGKPLYAGGYVSYFDITPDLRFILGQDSQIKNLYHCLGGGQALKYAPAFGELIAELIMTGKTLEFDLAEFSISRFGAKNYADFWSRHENTLNNDIL